MKKIYTLVGFALVSGMLTAQTPYAVHGQYQFASTTKHAPNGITFVDMRDAANHYADRVVFYTEDFDAGFNGWVAQTQSGPVDFEITNTGHANDAGSTFVIPALLTSTPTNWVLFDSDSDGSSGVQEDATLTSPVIDLVALGAPAAGPYQLKVEFEQFYAGWQSDTLFLAVSDDGGTTWDEVEIMNNSVGREGRPNPEIVSINISPYITNASNVKLRLRWTGNWDYGWQFDNITISELPDNDMKITSTFHGDMVNAFMYSQVPSNQVVPFTIGADVKNIGFLDQTNVKINWEIFDPSMTSLGSGVSTASIANLANNENDTIWVTTAITPSALGNYTIEFEVIADATDDELANNTMDNENYSVTTYTYATDYGNPTAAFYNWAGNNDGACSIGNIYTIENDDVIGGITARLDNNVVVEDQLMYYLLYKFDGSTYVYEDQTADYTTVTGDNGQFITLYFDGPITATAGDAFLAMGAHYGGTESVGFEMGGALMQGSVAGTDEATSLVSLSSPSAPFVRLLLNDFTSTEEMTVSDRFDVYPNPASENITVSLTLNKSENTVINVLDITGKIVATINVGTVNGDKNVVISLDEFNSGIYFIELVNNDGKQVKKFVKK
ncbi:MAG: T9SS type A sorting domain-containing protein [Crocinitomicaceae bacterium]|nr:T9SS type A sorting domain-containing protein [Crocinitomicaceae bacterium]MBK8926459.1 T9SS type A sorting domain-containing protein [Crocinitomicaceae bacterium]